VALAPGRRLGAYEIQSLIGSGGMGEVYRARDARLNRSVAIKVLPSHVAADHDRLARFEREAQVLASLNHPNIAHIYGVDDSSGTPALVMELAEGPTLADRIANGPIPIDQAVKIALQIAEALDAAHEQGIIHRDLKPANIKLTPQGRVKVLDFGLAKIFATEPVLLSQSPTRMGVTECGVILGTAIYMSPEQARGKAVDKRTDVWAFGCALFEMITGRPAFTGDTMPDLLAAIVNIEPPWTALPVETPAAVQRLLRRCLAKEPNERIRDIGDARLDLADARTESAAAAAPTSFDAVSQPRQRLPWVVAVVAVVAALALSVPTFYSRSAPIDAPETHLQVVTPPTTDPMSLAISPNGRRVVFVASGDGPPRLWLRSLDVDMPQPLPGTEDASFPFWSPDSRSVAFFAGGKLKRVDLGGGPPQVLAEAPTGRGGSWNRDGVILFAPTSGGVLLRVPASSGETMPVTRLGQGQTDHRFPQFLPNGRQFLFFVKGSSEIEGVYLGALDAPDTTRLTSADTAASYAPSGDVLFVRQGTLIARHLDAARGTFIGDLVTVANPVAFDVAFNVGAFAVSSTGVVAYRRGGSVRRQLTWYDRAGRSVGTFAAAAENQLDPELSPGDRRVAVSRVLQGNMDIWLLDPGRETRFTFDKGVDALPVWSPDSSKVVFRSNRKGTDDLYVRLATGAASETVLLQTPQPKIPADWSPDGRFLLYQNTDPNTGHDLWILSMEGDRRTMPFLQTQFNETQGQFSPDGHWVAYQSNESGSLQIYVQPFPGPGGTWQVSTGGGTQPRWRRDGQELFYVAPDGMLMAVPIQVHGPTIDSGAPVGLFQTRISGGSTGGIKQQYAVAADGRFLINVATEESTVSPITIVQNWKPR